MIHIVRYVTIIMKNNTNQKYIAQYAIRIQYTFYKFYPIQLLQNPFMYLWFLD